MSPLIPSLSVEFLLDPPDFRLIQRNKMKKRKVLKLFDRYGVGFVSFCEVDADRLRRRRENRKNAFGKRRRGSVTFGEKSI